MSKLAAFQARVSKLASDITYSDVTPPKSSTNVLASYLAASAPQHSVSNTYRINSCPDIIPSLLFLLNTTSQERSLLEKMSNPKVTMYTLLAYKLHIVYTWFLLHDLYVSPGSTPFAEDLIQDKYFSDLIEDTLEYPVPDDVITVISFWTTTCSESQTNIFFAPSLSHYLHYTHFGRLVPVNFFFNAHDIIATYSANTKAPILLAEFATLPLYTINEFVANPFAIPIMHTAATYTPRHYFGLCYENATTATTIERLANKHNQIIMSFLKFDSIKGLKAKGDYAPINIRAPVFTEHHGIINPYVMLLSATRENVSELQTVYRAVSSVINECKLANTNVSKCFTTIPSSGLENHGYSDFPSPHWDAHPADLTTDIDDFNKLSMTNISESTFATSILFKSNELAPANNFQHRDLTFGSITARLITSPATPPTALTNAQVTVRFTSSATGPIFGPALDRHQTFDLLTTLGTPTDYAEPPNYPNQTQTIDQVDTTSIVTGPLRSFDPLLDVIPRVKVICPQGNLPNSSSLTCLRGLIIYSDELTSASVPHLHSQDEIYDDNAQFLQSAIPMALTHLATNFKTTSPVPSRSTALKRNTANVQDATTMIRSSTHVYAPRLAARVFHLGYDRDYYGLTRPQVDQEVPFQTQTFIGHTVATRNPIRRTQAARAPDNTPTGHLLLWSPYTFRSQDFVLQDDTSIADILRNTHYLTNLRTIFGTGQKVTVCDSPIHAMPALA